MTEQEYAERNELISDFLGLRSMDGFHTYPSPPRGSCKPKYLEYHYNRNWLHKAWEKFRDLRLEGIHEQFEHSEFKQNIAHHICYASIDAAFQSIVSAIQWYNSINKKNHENKVD